MARKKKGRKNNCKYKLNSYSNQEHISETACENGNRMLDRGLVVPLAGREETSYFRELVHELCQVEI